MGAAPGATLSNRLTKAPGGLNCRAVDTRAMDTRLRQMDAHWRLAVKTLPAVVAIAVAKVIVTVIGLEDIELNPLYTGLVAGNIFLLGFLLAGTLADYKEAEKLPVDLAGSLDSIADEFRIVSRAHDGPVARTGIAHISAIARGVVTWLNGGEHFEVTLARVQALNDLFAAVEPLTQATYVNRLKVEQSSTRRMILRIRSIHETSFVVAGFLVAELTSALLVVVLLFIDVGSLGTDLIVLCTLTFLLRYVLLLIRDLDDPFDYEVAEGTGSAEVSLAPLTELAERLTMASDWLRQRESREDGAVSAPETVSR
jgi:hypothetical protein